ncbi:LysR substrate-binding domain-containing protein [Larkinella humicola]|uniref:LysR family transcriptional regulator n=1 Tax=Larkinella humicola TaxID=2607654 RepID=A0A5N1JIY6_9BACT|nr:LysR substrate-binding domain-containing protein [Larkinella humicola]KAA9354760.1 LysR family transcriptional regulator [Larkinella humicola]
MNYTLNQLRIFSTIVQTQSITKAAEVLHLTQPAVSIQLKNFQNQFEIPLTEVIGKKLYITDFGKEMAIAAENILNEVYAINYKTLAYKGQLTGRLKISVVSTGKYVMPYFLTDFMKQHPGIELVLDVTNKSKVISSLENNEVDFSLVSVLPTQLAISQIELMQNKLYLVGSQETNLGPQPHPMRLFETIPLIYREAGSGTRLVMERYLENNGLTVLKKMELTSNEAVKQAVIAGLGYSVMPLIGIKNELENGQLRIIPVANFPIKSVWSLIWLSPKKMSPVAGMYLEYVKKQKDAIIKERFNWFENYQ